MIVCLCNGVNCRAVNAQIDGGARSVPAVFRGLGCQPQCGTCGPSIRQMIATRRDTGESVPPLAAE
ncbi:MAG: (2Fe-2S)-binding protein [Alphaproteobacteria bacterium]